MSGDLELAGELLSALTPFAHARDYKGHFGVAPLNVDFTQARIVYERAVTHLQSVSQSPLPYDEVALREILAEEYERAKPKCTITAAIIREGGPASIPNDVILAAMSRVSRLSEIERVTVPEGWKLVPIAPTSEMQVAGFPTLKETSEAAPHPYTTWEAMLAAAPQPPHTGDAQEDDNSALGRSLK